MISGMSGSLLSHDAVERLFTAPDAAVLRLEQPAPARHRLRTWYAGLDGGISRAAGPRTVFDLIAAPLASSLGFDAVPIAQPVSLAGAETVDAELRSPGALVGVLLACASGRPLRSCWRKAVHRALAHGVRWALVVNGQGIGLFDAGRAYARRHLEFDLAAAIASERSLAILQAVLGCAGLSGTTGDTPLDRVIRHSERHRSMVRTSLRKGVHAAVLEFAAALDPRATTRRTPSSSPSRSGLDDGLVVVYRLLFLLFAEARGLVPTWHPVYRDSYSITTLRHAIDEGVERGVWETVQAVARLAHRGCKAGSLEVPPFNGRLFSPAHAPLAARARLSDRTAASALRALTTRVERGRHEPIAYADLGVEQLGGVYETLLDFDLKRRRDGSSELVPSGRRKSTGSFYTPRPLTEFIVRRALGPLVDGRTAAEILSLRIVDPAMGSGAFLVAACRYLAAGYEAALIREGALAQDDVSAEDRAEFRRLVTQQCLYGVDLNPMAVQLARLSLWLATLAAGKPLSFLDHRLRVGNSLVGASLADLRQAPAPRRGRPVRELPLFPEEDLQATLHSAIVLRQGLTRVPDDRVEQVREKERVLARLDGPHGTTGRWRSTADVWCAACLDSGVIEPGVFGALRDYVLTGASALPSRTAAALVSRARTLAASHHAFHWGIEFPEVCSGDEAGFDAVIGNPPWEMLRGDGGARDELSGFVRHGRQFRLQGDGHTNLYQLFFERGLRLLRPGGRCGVILPAGFANDHGTAPLRRHLFERSAVDTFTLLDNADGIFPIHRGLKFLLLTFGTAGATIDLPLRAVRTIEALEAVPDAGRDPDALRVPRGLLERVGGDGLAVPELRSGIDLRILSAVTSRVPALGSRDGWGCRFGRELNATDDRPSFNEAGEGLPVLEGKQLRPFGVDRAGARYWIARDLAARLVDPERTFARPRLGYRDVASASNRVTLIAAMIPAGAVTTHTVFCLKDLLDDEAQWFLCGVMNSYVANYLVRMRVGTHVTAAIISRLPMPRPARSAPHFTVIVRCARRLARGEELEALAELNAAVASLYGLSGAEFAHVLSTFPLVPEADRAAAARWYDARFVGVCP